MVRIMLRIEGMACGMCESHVNDAIRSRFPVRKVSSSHRKGITEIIAENPLDEESLREAIDKTGYTVLSVQMQPYTGKGIFKGLAHR